MKKKEFDTDDYIVTIIGLITGAKISVSAARIIQNKCNLGIISSIGLIGLGISATLDIAAYLLKSYRLSKKCWNKNKKYSDKEV